MNRGGNFRTCPPGTVERENPTDAEIPGADAEALARLSQLFAGDMLLASQIVFLRKYAPNREPIQRLMLATLGNGLDYFLDYYDAHPLSRRGRLSAEARRWLFADASDRPFSFAWVCDGLGL